MLDLLQAGCSIKRIRAEDIENALSNHVFRVLRDGGYLDEVAKRISAQRREVNASSRSIEEQLKKELFKTEQEMEAAFKFQLKADQNSESAKFLLNKLEDLGKRKVILEKELRVAKELESNVISLEKARENLEVGVNAITKGWKKFSAIQKRRALKRLIQELRIGPGIIDIFYYPNTLKSQGSHEGLSEEQGHSTNALSVVGYGKHRADSKLKVQNCTSARLVMPPGFEPGTYCLEGSCSIQLSYGTK